MACLHMAAMPSSMLFMCDKCHDSETPKKNVLDNRYSCSKCG